MNIKLQSKLSWFCFLTLFILTISLLTSCQQNKHHLRSNQVNYLYKKNKFPQRIISLAPNLTEIIYFLGQGSKIIAVTTSCDYPYQARKKTKVGSFGTPIIEKILSLNPDLVITSGFVNHPALTQMQKLGLNVKNFEFNKLDDVPKTMFFLEKVLTGQNYKSRKWQASWEAILSTPKKSPSKTLFLQLWPNSLITTGSKTYLNELIEISGHKNISNDLLLPYPTLSLEFLLKTNPQLIVQTFVENEKSSQEFLLGLLPAWKNKKTVNISADIILRPGPRLIEALKELKNL